MVSSTYSSEVQVQAGATGIIAIEEGIEQIQNQVANLPEPIIELRDLFISSEDIQSNKSVSLVPS